MLSTLFRNSVEASAPNITGQHGGHLRTIRYVGVTGAFHAVSSGATNSETGRDSMLVQFSAANCSGIYKDGATIRPISTQCTFYIKY